MLKDDNYIKGDFNAICDLCSLQFKGSELKKMWNGLYACKDCWEERHPCDTPPKPSKPRRLPFYRPEPEITFIPIEKADPTKL